MLTHHDDGERICLGGMDPVSPMSRMDELPREGKSADSIRHIAKAHRPPESGHGEGCSQSAPSPVPGAKHPRRVGGGQWEWCENTPSRRLMVKADRSTCGRRGFDQVFLAFPLADAVPVLPPGCLPVIFYLRCFDDGVSRIGLDCQNGFRG